jgi:hypothetical protein
VVTRVVNSSVEFNASISSGASIELSNDLFLLSTILISNIDSLVVNGRGYIISGQRLTQCFSIKSSKVSFVDVSFVDGFVGTSYLGSTTRRYVPEQEGNGGALVVKNSTVILTWCTLLRNTAQIGGAIYTSGGALIMIGCKVTANAGTYKKYGGGIYVDGGLLTLIDCEIEANVGHDHLGNFSVVGALTSSDCMIVVKSKGAKRRSSCSFRSWTTGEPYGPMRSW